MTSIMKRRKRIHNQKSCKSIMMATNTNTNSGSDAATDTKDNRRHTKGLQWRLKNTTLQQPLMITSAFMIALSFIAAVNVNMNVNAFTFTSPISLRFNTAASKAANNAANIKTAGHFALHAKKKKQPESEDPEEKPQSQSQQSKSKSQSQQPQKGNNKNKSDNKKSDNKKSDDTKSDNKSNKNNNSNILSLLSNPFQAGIQFRQTLDSVLKSASNLSPNQKAIYYLDDRFLDRDSAKSDSSNSNINNNNNLSSGALAFAQRNILSSPFPLSSNSKNTYQEQDYIPEVLVIGATGAIGRLVVRRLVLSGRFRVRVLVRDLYSNTLNMLGTGVTYCQGDLRNVESLEYAVTDVDKIVFCAGPPRVDEEDFGVKFRDFVEENLKGDGSGDNGGDGNGEEEEEEEEVDFQKLSNTMEIRAKLAQQVDDLGMQNVVRAYQNVRHADYGTSQAAKRSLFKFQDREEDYNLFTINVDEEVNANLKSKSGGAGADGIGSAVRTQNDSMGASAGRKNDKPYNEYNNDDVYGNDDNYDDVYGGDEYGSNDAYDAESTVQSTKPKPTKSLSSTVKSQVTWMKNQFSHGVFVGKLPIAVNGVGSEASIISSRLRSRDDPEKGTDLSNGFAGFVCRMCADGKTYQAYIRTSEYESNGIEYVCSFETEMKTSFSDGNKSLNKFQTVRLPFSKFKPIARRTVPGVEVDLLNVKSFVGRDVKQIGFRVDSADNVLANNDPNKARYKWMSFYIAICYIKVYRSQPEPEFVYLSDARIPAEVKSGMVRHDLKRILSDTDGEEVESLLINEEEAKRVLQNPKDRSGEELYYKYRGEEILKNSGLQYSIIRVPSLNELPSGEFSTIQLKQVSKAQHL